MEKAAIVSFTAMGNELGYRLQRSLQKEFECDRYTLGKYSSSVTDTIKERDSAEHEIIFENGRTLLKEIFYQYDYIIIIGACGIAVRLLDGLMRGKDRDAGVIVMDISGRFAIPLLSGHLGGANELALYLAGLTGAIPVITTATDVCHQFSPDLFAKNNHLYITDLESAKYIAAASLEGKCIGILSELPIKNLPPHFLRGEPGEKEIAEKADVLINIGETDCIEGEYHKVILHLIPQDIIIGVGCRRNISPEVFEAEIMRHLRENNIDIRRVRQLHSVTLKKEEKAILDFAKEYRLQSRFFSPEELREARGNFQSSDFVNSVMGVDNICERSAVMTGAKLIVTKRAGNGVTFAAARMDMAVDFEKSNKYIKYTER